MSRKRALLADDMGLGKTCMSVVAFSSLGSKSTLIICPPAVLYSWEREIEKWSVRHPWIQVMEGMMCKVDDAADVVICPYSILHSPFVAHQLKERRWGVLLIDEVHYLKSAKANRTHVVYGKGNSKGIVHNAVYIWTLSGTPMTNTPIDLWTILNKLNKKALGKYCTWMKFTGRFCKRYLDTMGRWNVTGANHLDELNKILFESGFALRREKREVLKDLPPKQLRILPMKSLKASLCKEVNWDEKLKQSDIQGGLTCDGEEIAEARKEVGMAKIPHITAHVKEILTEQKKVVLFCWHQDVVDEYCRLLPDSVKYNGSMSPKQKDIALQKFTKGSAKVFVANFLSAGTGLDGLQYVCSYACFAELPWTYSELMQAADRLDRFGQESKPLIDVVVCKKTIDQYIMKKVFTKEKYHKDLLTDGIPV